MEEPLRDDMHNTDSNDDDDDDDDVPRVSYRLQLGKRSAVYQKKAAVQPSIMKHESPTARRAPSSKSVGFKGLSGSSFKKQSTASKGRDGTQEADSMPMHPAALTRSGSFMRRSGSSKSIVQRSLGSMRNVLQHFASPHDDTASTSQRRGLSTRSLSMRNLGHRQAADRSRSPSPPTGRLQRFGSLQSLAQMVVPGRAPPPAAAAGSSGPSSSSSSSGPSSAAPRKRSARAKEEAYGGNFAIYPTGTVSFFGRAHFGANYGFVFLGFGLSGVIFTVLNSLLVKKLGYPAMTLIVGGFCFFGFLLSFYARREAMKELKRLGSR